MNNSKWKLRKQLHNSIYNSIKKDKIFKNKPNQGGESFGHCTLYKTLLKDRNKHRDILYLWTGCINIVKMSILLQVIYRFNTIPIKISAAIFTETDKLLKTFIQKYKEPIISKIILKKNKVE